MDVDPPVRDCDETDVQMLDIDNVYLEGAHAEGEAGKKAVM